jgi:hypothetical protein
MTKIGRSAFRCLIPFDRIRADPDTWALFENEPPGFLATVLSTNNVFCMSYPCRKYDPDFLLDMGMISHSCSGEILNCVILHDTREDQQGEQGKIGFDYCCNIVVSIC